MGAPHRPRKGGWGAEGRCVEQGPYFSVSPLVFPSLSSAFVLGALLLSPSLTIATTDVVAERAGENVTCKKINDMFFEHIISYFTFYAVHLMGGVVGMGGAQKGGASNSPARK